MLFFKAQHTGRDNIKSIVISNFEKPDNEFKEAIDELIKTYINNIIAIK